MLNAAEKTSIASVFEHLPSIVFVPIIVHRAAAKAYGQDTGDVVQKDHDSGCDCSPKESWPLEDINVEKENGEPETGNPCAPKKFRKPRKTLKGRF